MADQEEPVAGTENDAEETAGTTEEQGEIRAFACLV